MSSGIPKVKVQNRYLVAPPVFVGLLSPLEVTMVLCAAAPPAHGMCLWCWFPMHRLSGQPSSLPQCCHKLCPHVTHPCAAGSGSYEGWNRQMVQYPAFMCASSCVPQARQG